MRRRKPKRLVLDIEELKAILERVKAVLDAEDYKTLKAVVETLVWLIGELKEKKVTIARLRMFFGMKKTETTSKVLKEDQETHGTEPPQSTGDEKSGEKAEKKKRKGHGRNGTAAYWGAERVTVPHESLKSGEPCPTCERGKVYAKAEPSVLVCVRGQAPLHATAYERETLRCNLCGEVFRAKAPEDAGEERYDETAASMIALLKYGSGMPFHRLEILQGNLGVPLPASTQWDIVAKRAPDIGPVYEELIRQAAQGEVLHNDDTGMKILTLMAQNERIQATSPKERTGMFTSGIVSIGEGHQIALFFTGRKHAGENLADLLKQRASELDPPIHMCDGLSRNEPKDFETILANCVTHGRRKFVEVADSFPEECRYVLETLRQVYKHDATTREQKMSAQERLNFHQAHSAELMADLKRWLTEQIEDKKIEENSSLGDAISYMLKRWDKLTLFLRKPGAPLDNNTCERALKKAILHRKGALFFKTENGARVGDRFMSLIYTAELSGANPFDYLTKLLKHSEEVRRSPHEWMPWNYQATAAALAQPRSPPSRAAPSQPDAGS
jgi:transposase